ncbi:cobalamin-binding protein [filamentous cyanobacterium CCP5]|nr:cobalamin-binding protein [filamentous cyanobacterium CCP5]
MADLRIVSLIPSATEIIHSLGLGDCLVGRSHECDYPASVQSLPVCTEPKFEPEGSSPEIHDRVTTLLQSALSVYRVKTEVLEPLRPTHILTQAQCEVCAVSLGDVEAAVAQLTDSQPQVISLQPNRLMDLWTDFQTVAVALEGKAGMARAQAAIAPLQQRLHDLANQVQRLEQPTVACIEWPDPLMAAGNWVPELVELAGGQCLFGTAGQHSPWLDWPSLVAANPDCIVFMPCGYDLAKTAVEAKPLTRRPEWSTLKAVQNQRVFITDGNQYFNRPGPRLVDSAEILAEIFHAQPIGSGYGDRGWQLFR